MHNLFIITEMQNKTHTISHKIDEQIFKSQDRTMDHEEGAERLGGPPGKF